LSCLDTNPKKVVLLQAHQYLLCAASPIFRSLLNDNICTAYPRPLIYLNNISPKELDYVIDLIYKGEVRISINHSSAFIKAVNRLQIKVKEYHSISKTFCKDNSSTCSECSSSVIVQKANSFCESKSIFANKSTVVDAASSLNHEQKRKDAFCTDSKLFTNKPITEQELKNVELALKDIEDTIHEVISQYQNWKTWSFESSSLESQNVTSEGELMEIEEAIVEIKEKLLNQRDDASHKVKTNDINQDFPWDIMSSLQSNEAVEPSDAYYRGRTRTTPSTIPDDIVHSIASTTEYITGQQSIFEVPSYTLKSKIKHKGAKYHSRKEVTSCMKTFLKASTTVKDTFKNMVVDHRYV
jgi:hypothetical protein